MTSAKQPLGFFDLPPEIRFQILEFTELNPANAQVTPSFGYVPIWRGRLGIPDVWRMKSYSLCKICARNTSSYSYCLWRRFSANCPLLRSGWSHLEESVWLSKCRCRSIPFSLLVVSKQMKADVEYTLCKFNGFEFFPCKASDVSRHLMSLTEDKIRLIRDLRFTFSYVQMSLWNEWGRNNWRLLMNWIKYSKSLRNLRLVIDAECHFILPDCMRPEMSGSEDDSAYVDLYKMVCEIALEVAIIHEKVQDLHLRLPYFHCLERLLEQEVMGSDYDSYQGSGLWRTLEPRLLLPCGRLPRWHDVEWGKITSRYKRLVHLLEQSKSKD